MRRVGSQGNGRASVIVLKVVADSSPVIYIRRFSWLFQIAGLRAYHR